MPAFDASNPWIEGTRIGVTEDGYYVLTGKAPTHPDELVFEPKDGIFPDVGVKLSSDLLNKEDLIVNETLIWQQDKAQVACRHHLKRIGATST